MARKNRLFAKLATDVDTSGNLQASGIQSEALDAGVTVYASRANLPSSGNTAGDQAYVTGNNRLYIWNGSGWYNIALLNVAPSIQSVLDSDGGTTPFTLAIDGTATTITITAADSDGDPITYAASADSDFSGLATLSQADNVFTVTPFSVDSATTSSGTITFTATDGINVGSSGVQTFTLNFLSPLWDETILSVGTSSTNSLTNSTFIDRSTNAWGSAVNTWGTSFAQTSFHPYLDNWSVEFDGTSNGWIQDATSSGDYTFGTSDFTIELFVNFDTIADAYLWSAYDGGNGGFALWFSSSNGLSIRYGDNATVQRAWSPNASQWYHIAIARESGTMKMFVDGTLLGTSFSYTTDIQHVLALGSFIGKYNLDQGQVGGYFNGKISNLRIVKGSAVYTANFDKPTENLTDITNTVLLTCQSRSFIDNSSFAQSFTVGSGVSVSSFNPFGQGSEYAVGENKGSVSFTTTDGIDLKVRSSGTASTWTIEFWYKFDPTSTINANHYLFDSRGTAGSQTAGSLYLYRSSATTYNDGGNYGITDANFNDGIWHWFTMVSDGANRAVWIDGIRIAELGGSRTVGTHLWINSRESNQYHNDCEYSDFRFSSTARYATSSTTITVPTSPVGTDGNTTAYYPFDNPGIFDKTGNNILTLVGNTSTSTTQTKFADTAMYFDGTGDCIIIEDNDLFDFGSVDFTIEGWFYQNSTSNMGLFGKRETNTQYGTINLDVNGGYIRFLISTTNGGWASASATSFAPTLNTWYHLALVRDTSASTLTLYANGTNVGQLTSFSSTIVNTTYPFIIGNSVENTTEPPFNGYIENFQVLKGVAKYTTNFTPPTSVQGRTYQLTS